MPDLVVEPAVLREVSRRLAALAGSFPVRAGSSALDGAAAGLPGSRTADAATSTARSWSGDGEDLRTAADGLAGGIADAAGGYERTDTDLAERTS